ncbi:MAG: peptidase T [Candidatus Heimdallarchaeota archaeon]|nr:peptidase T [Candidatus Heimdallarchaeota archaeon]
MSEIKSSNIAIIVHGGAWSIPENMVKDSISGVEEAVKIGWEILLKGGSALDAVENAVNSMEENPIFNAGKGAALNERGNVELDAIIIDGAMLNTGAVASVKNIIHTVSLARIIMEKTEHVFIIGEGANLIAKENGFEEISEEELITESTLNERKQFKFRGAVNTLYNVDTVGAVALDSFGNIAAATSTGGITGKKIGRIGDSPIIGAGAYADNKIGGASATGHGESILKVMLSRNAIENLKYGLNPLEAAKLSLQDMKSRVGGHGGLILLDKLGNIGFHFTTEKMVWAYIKNDKLVSGI